MSIRHLLPALLILAASACDDLGLSAEPERLRLEVEATGASQVTLVTSTRWVYSRDPACEPTTPGCPDVLRVLDADTATVASPHSRTLRFTDDYKYMVEVFPAGGVTATVRMNIEIDGKNWFDEARELTPTGANGEQETLQFVYQWRQPTLR